MREGAPNGSAYNLRQGVDLRPQTDKQAAPKFRKISGMANIAELLSGHVTLEAECLDRLYLNRSDPTGVARP